MGTYDTLNTRLPPDASMAEVRSLLHELEARSVALETRQVYATIGSVARLTLLPDERQSPFFVGLDYRPDGNARRGQYNDEELKILREAATQVQHAGLAARLADILWLLVREAPFARQAITAYVDYARARDHVELVNDDPQDATDSLRRAASLAQQTGKKSPLLDDVLQAVERTLAQHRDDDQQGRYSHALLKVLFRLKRGDLRVLAEQAEDLARRCEGLANWSMARTHWDTAALFHNRAGQPDQSKAAKLAAAEAFVQYARGFIRPGSPPFLAVKELMRAVQLLRDAGATRERVQEVLREIRSLQGEEDRFMRAFPVEVPAPLVRDHQRAGQDQVTGLTFTGALQQLTRIAALPPMAALRKAALDALKTTVVQHLATITLGDHAGRQQVTLNSEEEYLAFQMSRQAANARLLAVISLDAAVAQVRQEHSIGPQDLAFIVASNVRLPAGHAASVQRGLRYGLAGDFLAAIPMLLPQLEAGLRHMLNTEGVETTGLDTSGVQQEHNLNTFLTDEKYTRPLERVLGEAFVYDLRTLLVEKVGENLRNTSAHGLALDGQLEDIPARYTWALILRFFLGGVQRP
ncbi:DUF4209 domain-containing protein [Deinococcus aetherius]|nr:DUF4209 domain-containing protein [Deinococcus aetherius]